MPALLTPADVAPAVDLHLGSRVIRLRLAELALPDTAFPHLTLIRQMDVETELEQALADRGVAVERGTELVGQPRPQGLVPLVTAVPGPWTSVRRARCPCDGAHSGATLGTCFTDTT